MKIDAYMPLYGADFALATKGYGRSVKGSYVSALIHYWHHTHCDGLPDDDEYLRNICECPDKEWDRTKRILFGNNGFFRMDCGRWHQPRCREEYDKSQKAYQSICERSRKGVEARKQQPEAEPKVEPQVKPRVNQSESELESEGEPKPLVHTPPRREGYPTLEEVRAKAQMTGLPEDQADRFWNHWESSGWIDKNGNQIQKWQSKLAVWASDYRAKPFEAAHKQEGKPAEQSKTFWQLNQELKLVQDEIKLIEDRASQTAMGLRVEARDKQAYEDLKKRRRNLKQKLGIR